MKNKRLAIVSGMGVLAWGALMVRGCTTNARGFFSEIEVDVPASAVVSYERQGSLTGDEYLVTLKLPPAQIPALLAQFKTKRDFIIGPYNPKLTSSVILHDPWVARTFKTVPPSAQGGSFRVDHNIGEKTEWPTLCDYAVDKATGRVWIYGWSIYN